MEKKKKWQIIAVAIIALVIMIILALSIQLGPEEVTRPDARVQLLHIDGNGAAVFVVVKIYDPVVPLNGSSVIMASNGNLLGPSDGASPEGLEPRAVNWTGSHAVIWFEHDNATFAMLIEDLDYNNLVSNGDRITLLSSEGFKSDWAYSFWFYQHSDTYMPYLYSSFYPKYFSPILNPNENKVGHQLDGG